MYINVKKRKRKNRRTGEYREEKFYSAIIRFNGHEFSRSTGKTTYREAKSWANTKAKSIQASIENLKQQEKDKNEQITLTMLFGHWWNTYAHKQRSAYDMKLRAKQLHEIIGPDFLIKDIDDDYVDELVVNLFEGRMGERSPATVNRIIDILKAAIREGKKHRIWKREETKGQFISIDWSIHRQKEPKERVVFLSPSEAEEIMDNLPKHISLAVAWSIYTGCRLNETATLVKDKIYSEARYCEVFAKGGYYRNVVLSHLALRIIGEAVKDHNSRDEKWYGTIFNLENRRKHWEAAREAVGKPEMRWHDLRHVGATWLRQYGKLDLSAVGRALGHSGTEVTKRYAHIADSELMNAYDALPNVTGLV